MKTNIKKKRDNKNEKDRITCKICGKNFSHLGSHLWHKHRILAREYKEEFGLPHNYALISQSVHEKKVAGFNENREYYLDNIRKGSIDHRFVKGRIAHKNRYRSKMEIEQSLKNIEKINNRPLMVCPVCNIRYKHIESHLYNKHKLITVD